MVKEIDYVLKEEEIVNFEEIKKEN